MAKLTTPENKEIVEKYIKEVVGKSDMERTSTGVDRGKTGVPLGAFAIHPITKEKVCLSALIDVPLESILERILLFVTINSNELYSTLHTLYSLIGQPDHS